MKIISNLAVLVKILYIDLFINRLFLLFMTKKNQGLEKGMVPEQRQQKL